MQTRERRESSRELRDEAEGVEVVDRRRVGESRIRWILRLGWEVCRVLRRVVRVLWVEVVDASLR